MAATMRKSPPSPLANQTPTPAVLLDGVTRAYGGQLVVSGVDLAVYPGEFVSIVGPSGCGKTTLLRLIAGFEQPDSGHITINGRRMEGVPTYLRNTAIVVQNFALFRNMTVQQNVEFGLDMRGVGREERERRARSMLDLVGLSGLENRQVDQLSGGQRQRVALARALVVEPDVLLLDEPLGSLDANLRVRMQSELKRLQRSLGITFVHVTGNQSEAIAMADRIAVVGNGRIAQEGVPRDVYRNPATRFVAQFMGNNNLIPATIASVDAAAGTASLSSTLGEMTLMTDNVHPGDRGALCIRTDRVQFASSGEPEPEYTVAGTIVGEEFAGSTLTYDVQVGIGTPLRIERHLSMRELRDRGGSDTVTIGWNRADMRFVTEDEARQTTGDAA
jgi:ABC-type Fe3+/spermidine/putrescine transport system ATPase subunit